MLTLRQRCVLHIEMRGTCGTSYNDAGEAAVTLAGCDSNLAATGFPDLVSLMEAMAKESAEGALRQKDSLIIPG
jgi:hypothetical protein